MKKSIAILDWVATFVLLGVSVWVVVDQWPSPEWWAWAILVLGLVGIPLNLFNPMQKVRTFVLRKLIKR